MIWPDPIAREPRDERVRTDDTSFGADTRHDAVFSALVAEHGSPLMVLSRTVARDTYAALKAALPGVRLHYAIKALPHPILLKVLKDQGASFDVCTPGEIELVQELGIDPSRVMHTHPIKRPGDIRDAVAWGCKTFIFDNPSELDKFAGLEDEVELLLRLSFRSATAVVDLSQKFGAAPHDALGLLRAAADRGLKVIGLAFHVGSQALTSDEHGRAIAFCADLITHSRDVAPHLRVVDIGGGFPVTYDDEVPTIARYCAPIAAALADLPEGVEVIAEPGRYLSAPTAVLVTSVIGRADRGGRRWYYIDDGVYGALSGKLYDHANYTMRAMRQGPVSPCVVAGPTCDGFDVVCDQVELPDLQVGDLIVVPMAGAYTLASATEFNLFPKTRLVGIDT